MSRRLFFALRLAAVSAATIAVAVFVVGASASGGGATGSAYTPATPVLATITDGASADAPWNLFQGDPAAPGYASNAPGTLLPTYTPGGASSGGSPNIAVYPGAASGTDGDAPYPSGTVGTPGPLNGYCGTGNNAVAAAGSPARQPEGTTLPLAPAYFPHIVRNSDGSLTGYFDYRPKDADEAIVTARSTDAGVDWTYEGEALEQNPGYCPNSDINDDGEGHANVITVGGVSRLYTLQRAAGDNVGVGMLVHTLNPTAANPLNGVPGTEKVGVDPDDFAASSVAVSSTPGTISLSNPIGTGPEQLVAGGFVDLTATPTPTKTQIITCTGASGSTLTGCTNAAGVSVGSGDLIEQVLGTVSSNLAAASPQTGCASGSSTPTLTGGGSLPCQVPSGPNTTTGDAGLAGFGLTATNTNNLDLAIFNADAPNRGYIDGVAVYCNQSNAFPTSKIEGCTTGPGNSSLTVNAGDPVTSDPIVPATAQQTTGLVAPDGIVGVLPSYPGAPVGSTVVMYTEKVLNYYDVGFTGGKAAIGPGSGDVITPSGNLAFTAFPNSLSAPLNPGANTISIGDSTTTTIVQIKCTGYTASTHTLTGCTAPGVTASDSISKNSYLVAAGGAVVPAATLAQTGGGAPSTNTQKVFKNNEDLTVLRVAYTTDGVNFSTAGLDNGGVISGQSNGATNYSDINNPSSTTSPANLNAYATAGTALATEMRFVGAAGSIITNPDGTYGMFLSGAWAADGDSDAFNQIYYTSSSDGEHWSIPVSVISTDYTFSASRQQSISGGPLGISAYYSGRAYGPSVVQNPDGTLTMVFAGYRLPSPAGTVGVSYGTNASAQYTIGASDPLLYRQILAVQLSSSTTPGVTTATAVGSSANPSIYGDQVAYTAMVSVPSPGAGTPTGTVSFTEDGNPISGCEAAPLSETTPDVATCDTVPSSAGTHAIEADYSGDSNYATSYDDRSQNVDQADQTISFGPLADHTYGDADFSLTATATSGLTVSFGVGGNCTLADPTTVHISGAGSCTVTASQPGDADYNSAPEVTQTFQIAREAQTIAIDDVSDHTFGDSDFQINATATSGLPVSLTATTDVCTLSSATSPATVHIAGIGTCTITASQDGGDNYQPATAQRTFQVSKAAQTITFGPLSNTTYGAVDFAISATASSGLPISFAAAGQCTLNGTSVHITDVGTCTITASQTGNDDFNPAPDVAQSFQIAKADQTIAFTQLPATLTFGGSLTLGATASSGLPVTFAAGSGSVCTVSGTTVTSDAVGSCTVVASQAGSGEYNPATASQTFQIVNSPAGTADGDGLRLASGGTATFHVEANPPGPKSGPAGTLVFDAAPSPNPHRKTPPLHFEAKTITAFGLTASGHAAWFAGTARDGTPFLAYAEDNGGTPRGPRKADADVLQLWINGVLVTGNGSLKTGNVTIGTTSHR